MVDGQHGVVRAGWLIHITRGIVKNLVDTRRRGDMILNMDLQCPVCGKSNFQNERGLKQHIARVHGYCCEKCDRTFSSRTLLLNHKISDHGEIHLLLKILLPKATKNYV